MQLKRLAYLLFFLCLDAAAQPPKWYHDYLAGLAPDTGAWIAENAAYRSDAEPSDAYGLEWHWGLGRQSVTGRLFGLIDGEETGTYWEFRIFWHPGDHRVVVQQFGSDGTFGTGILYMVGDDKERLEQTFYAPDGSANRAGHETALGPDIRSGFSFDIHPDGGWQARRQYDWRLTARGSK